MLLWIVAGMFCRSSRKLERELDLDLELFIMALEPWASFVSAGWGFERTVLMVFEIFRNKKRGDFSGGPVAQRIWLSSKRL